MTTPIPGVQAIALLDGRIVTAGSLAQLHHALDVALDGKGSLAQNPAVSSALASLKPISALDAVDQTSLAADCDLNTIAPSSAPAGRDNYTLVAYGRLGSGGDRRTMVAVSYPDESAAGAELTTFADGWTNGYVNARGTGASIDSYGTLNDVSQSGNLLVAELIDGRDDGWVRSGIRFALPACEAAMAIAPAATPDLTGGAGRLPTMERLSAALPGAGDSGERYRAVDLHTVSAARGVTAPDDADAEAISAWLTAIGPLPALDTFPSDPAELAAWSSLFGIELSGLSGVAEFNSDPTAATIGVLIGTWDEATLTATLTDLGYQTIVIGSVRHFALDQSTAPNAFLAEHPIWTNIALLGDRIWISADQSAMRAELADATDGSATADSPLRPYLSAAYALRSEGADAINARCGSVMTGAIGFAVGLEVAGADTLAHYAVMLDEPDSCGKGRG